MVSHNDIFLWPFFAVALLFGGYGLVQETAKMMREQRQAREARRVVDV